MICVLALSIGELLLHPPWWATVVAVISIPAVSISLSYFGGASIHTTIAYTTIRQEARRSREEYLRLIDQEILPPAIDKIEASTRAELGKLKFPELPKIPDYSAELAELRAKLDGFIESSQLDEQLQQIHDQVAAMTGGGNLADEFDEYVRSDRGKAWSRAIAEAAGQQISNTMTARITSEAGKTARRTQMDIVALLDRTLDFENPIMNGLWKMAPRDQKLRVLNGLARVIRKSGLINYANSIDTTGQEVPDEPSDGAGLAEWGGDGSSPWSQ